MQTAPTILPEPLGKGAQPENLSALPTAKPTTSLTRIGCLPAARQAALGSFFATPLVVGRTIYIGSADGRLYALQ